MWKSLGIVFGRLGGRLALVVLVPCATLWMVAAVGYSNLPGVLLPRLASAVLALYVLVVLAVVRDRWRAVVAIGLLFLCVLLWWLWIPASNDRDWQNPVAVLPTAEFSEDGDVVTVRNIRNFEYRSRSDYDVRYYDRQFDLDAILGVDFFICHWGAEAIGHTFVSFRFEGDKYLALSVEIRPEKGEFYHPLPGLFKQYEIIYVLGDERDIVRLRTNHRGEDVYLYRGVHAPDRARALFLDVLERVNELASEPAFYGTIGANCTTSLVRHVNRVTEERIPFSGRVLLNGFSDRLVYERGSIERPLPFIHLKPACYISDVAKTLDDNPAFSSRIREHVDRRIRVISEP